MTAVFEDDPRDDVRVATFADGSQIMVTVWPHGEMEVARRDKPWHSWGPPAHAEEAP